jgi:DNA-directed RNA polymerase specialized sigma subunit
MSGFIDLKGEGPFASASADTGRLEPEYQTHYDQWKAKPAPATKSKLLRSVDPVINQAIQTYGGVSKGSPVLRSRARKLALRSFESYDPQRASLRTHLMNQLQGLQRPAAQEAQIVRLPEGVALNKQHLDETEKELAYKLGRDPSDQQLANHTGLSMKRIKHIRQAKPTIAHGSVMSGPEESAPEMPASQIPGSDPQAEGWEELIYYDLDDVDQYIFDRTLGRHGRKTWPLKRIADNLGITPSAASQRAARIQKKLDERFDQEIF